MSPEAFAIRPARSADLAALTAIKPTSAMHTDRIHAAASGQIDYLVAIRADAIVGFAILVFVRPPSWPDHGDARCLPQVVDLHIASHLADAASALASSRVSRTPLANVRTRASTSRSTRSRTSAPSGCT
jgi:hypothetical protein